MISKVPKFRVGQVVVYVNGDTYELGVIKSIVMNNPNAPVGEETYSYRVWYHTGETTALTNEHNLHYLVNEYAFTITRKKIDDN